ncbi:TonB-dependent receptor [Iodidimonas sp. SYSU 1G8]|uniref:TonB-dependent receptor n=1 Tax=Iodidimonas sp. SYSU 1G8 TaxID=3133967 RepID=UPI0031FF1078
MDKADFRSRFWGPAAVLAVSVSGFALSTSVALAQAEDAAAANAGAPRTSIETVTTQAQKVETNIQSTPVAVTAISGDTLQRSFAQDLRDLSKNTPNVMLEPVGAFQNASAFFIRGFGSTDIESAGDPGVGIFVDGVYQARSSTGLSDMLDVEAVEVLRGPQGTLFGRNTIVGAVLLNHKKPDVDEFGVSGSVLAGNYGRIDIKGVVNVPIVEGVAAVRLAMKSTNFDGFYTNTVDNKPYGGNERLTFNPSLGVVGENWDLTIRGEFARIRDDSYANVQYSQCPGTNGVPNVGAFQTVPLISVLYKGNAGLDACGIAPSKESFTVSHDNTSGRGSDFDVWGITGELNYNIPDVGTLSYVGNYRNTEEDVYNDFDATDLPVYMTRRQQDHWQTSHELRFASEFSDTVDFVAGLYYFKQRYYMEQDTFGWLFDAGFGNALRNALGVNTGTTTTFDDLNPNAGGFGATTQTNESWAAFLNVNYHITDTITLFGGLRYTEESKDFETCAPSAVNDRINRLCNTTPGLVGSTYYNSLLQLAPGDSNWSNVSPKAGVNWQATDDLFVYGSWTRGFRSGGFNGRCGTPFSCTPFDPEVADSYELGFKWDPMQELRINLTGFWLEYKNQQVPLIRQSPGGSGGGNETVTANAGSARAKGVELEVTAVPTEGLKMWGALGFLDAKRTSFCADVDGVGAFPGAPGSSCNPDDEILLTNPNPIANPNGYGYFPVDASGLPLTRAPKWTLSAGLSYEVPVGDLGFVEFAADWRYQSRSLQAAAGIPPGSTAGIQNYNGVLITPWRDNAHVFNGSVTFNEADDRYRVSFFVKNITNVRYVQSITAVAALFNFMQPNEPRHWGVEISFDL